MKRRILALLMCIVLVIGLFGCTKENPSETSAPTETAVPTTAAPTEPPAAELYAQAKASVLEADSLTESVSKAVVCKGYVGVR